MRILLCDNHRLLVEALAVSLRRLGHHIVAMTTLPQEAVDAAVECDPDVCLLDVVFPGGHGIDTVASIRAAIPPATKLNFRMLTLISLPLPPLIKPKARPN